MRVILAQEFKVVRREVDHHEATLRAQQPRGFRDRACAVVEEVQHLMHDHDVEGILRHRQFVDVALPHAAVLEARAFKPRARERQQQIERLNSVRAKRDEAKCRAALDGVAKAAADKGSNLLAAAIEAARARATVGEISDAMEKVFGRHRAEIRAISGVYAAGLDSDGES